MSTGERHPGGVVSAEKPIPDKAYFRIGEVASILGVKPYVLRYWESEFHVVRPQKSRSQQRLYRRRDVEVLQRIKHLLYQERYIIEGARKRLRESTEEPTPERAGTAAARPANGASGRALETIKADLKEILKLVDE